MPISNMPLLSTYIMNGKYFYQLCILYNVLKSRLSFLLYETCVLQSGCYTRACNRRSVAGRTISAGVGRGIHASCNPRPNGQKGGTPSRFAIKLGIEDRNLLKTRDYEKIIIIAISDYGSYNRDIQTDNGYDRYRVL